MQSLIFFQYFYVAEICNHLNPKSSFPGSDYQSFEEYYQKKYGITVQNSQQPLLDVDHTSARLNFLTPRYQLYWAILTFWLFVRIKVCSAVTKLSVHHSLLLGTALPHFQPSCLLDFFSKAYRMVAPSIHSCCATLHNFIHDLRLWCETKTAKWQ